MRVSDALIRVPLWARSTSGTTVAPTALPTSLSSVVGSWPSNLTRALSTAVPMPLERTHMGWVTSKFPTPDRGVCAGGAPDDAVPQRGLPAAEEGPEGRAGAEPVRDVCGGVTGRSMTAFQEQICSEGGPGGAGPVTSDRPSDAVTAAVHGRVSAGRPGTRSPGPYIRHGAPSRPRRRQDGHRRPSTHDAVGRPSRAALPNSAPFRLRILVPPNRLLYRRAVIARLDSPSLVQPPHPFELRRWALAVQPRSCPFGGDAGGL